MNSSWTPIGGLCVLAAIFGYWAAGPSVEPAPTEAVAAAPVEAAPEVEAPTESTPTPVAEATSPPAPGVAASKPAERAPNVAEIRRRLLAVPPAPSPAPVAAEVISRSERPAQDGDPDAFATSDAMEEVDMTSMLPSHDDYDEVVEAQQRFNAFELDVRAQEELTPEVWAEVKSAHMDDLEAMLERSEELADAGFISEADSLILEWDAMERALARRVE
jgi:hypothetical protein